MKAILTTKIRLSTIIFSLAILTAFGTVPYIVFIKQKTPDDSVLSIIAIVLFLLLMAGLISVIWLTLIIRINKQQRIITFIYPFRLKSNTFTFDELIGFRYKYLNARIAYKALLVRTKTGKTYTFSDFETSNLREFEAEFIQLLDLRKGKHFSKISTNQKEIEINNSKVFDKEQAKDIRFYLYLIIIVSAVIIGDIISTLLTNSNKITLINLSFSLFMMIILITTCIKLKKVNLALKEHKKFISK